MLAMTLMLQSRRIFSSMLKLFLSTFKFHHVRLFKNLHCFKSHLLKNFSKLTYSGVLVWSLSCWIFSKTYCGDSFSDKRISIFWNKSLQKKNIIRKLFFKVNKTTFTDWTYLYCDKIRSNEGKVFTSFAVESIY